MNWILIAAWTLAIISLTTAIGAARDKDGPGWRFIFFVASAFFALVAYNLFTF